MNNKKSRYQISMLECLVLFYLIILDIRYLMDLNMNIVLAIWCISGAVIYMYLLFKKKYLRKFLIFLFTMAFIGAVNAVVNRNHPWQYFFVLINLGSCGAALYDLRKRLRTVDIWTICTFFIIEFRILYMRITIPDFSYEKNKLTVLMGCNTASIMVIFLLFLDYIYRESINKKPRYSLYAIAAVVAIVTGGNGNILSLSLLLLGIFLVRNKDKKVSYIKVLMIIVIGVIILAYEGVDELIKFLTDDHYRFIIWNEYFQMAKMSVKNMIFGADITDNMLLTSYGHCHNTFINIHFYYGLLPLLVVVVGLIRSIKYSFDIKNYFYITFLGVTIIRSMTDEALLILLPVWCFYFCMFYIRKNNLHYERV